MELKSSELQQLFREWESSRGTRLFPSGADIEPLSMRYILEDLTVVDVFYDPLRFFYRIHASASAERIGFDLTGKFLDDLPDANLRATMQGTLLTVLQKRAPHLISYSNRPVAGAVTGDLEVLALPFSSDGQTIDMIAYGTHFNVHKGHAPRLAAAPANPA